MVGARSKARFAAQVIPNAFASPGSRRVQFSVVKARPAMGRLFSEDDAGSPATTTTAILSHVFWQRRFDGAGDAVGRTIQLDERLYTVVGVMPADFAFPDRETQVWIPQRIQPVAGGGGKFISVSIFSVLARMRPGVTPEQVAAEATSRARAGADLGPAGLALFGSRAAPTIVAVPALDVLTAEVRPALGILLVAVLMLLTTAVGSIAMLQLARATRRRREITVRTALGARTIHLTRQWLSESALVGIAGGTRWCRRCGGHSAPAARRSPGGFSTYGRCLARLARRRFSGGCDAAGQSHIGHGPCAAIATSGSRALAG